MLVGAFDGSLVGAADGNNDGANVGAIVRAFVGFLDGFLVGNVVGSREAACVGGIVGVPSASVYFFESTLFPRFAILANQKFIIGFPSVNVGKRLRKIWIK